MKRRGEMGEATGDKQDRDIETGRGTVLQGDRQGSRHGDKQEEGR